MSGPAWQVTEPDKAIELTSNQPEKWPTLTISNRPDERPSWQITDPDKQTTFMSDRLDKQQLT